MLVPLRVSTIWFHSFPYFSPMYAHCLGSQAVQLLPVKLGRPTVVLLLSVLRTIALQDKIPNRLEFAVTLVSQLWLRKKVRALALPPSCIWRSCCQVQFVSRFVDLAKKIRSTLCLDLLKWPTAMRSNLCQDLLIWPRKMCVCSAVPFEGGEIFPLK